MTELLSLNHNVTNDLSFIEFLLVSQVKSNIKIEKESAARGKYKGLSVDICMTKSETSVQLIN